MQELSQWPTYPQLYLNGELLGGCDIVLEMAEAGELQVRRSSPANALRSRAATPQPRPAALVLPAPDPAHFHPVSRALPRLPWLQSELAKAKPAAGAVADPKAALRSRLEALVNQKDVMLFMKVGGVWLGVGGVGGWVWVWVWCGGGGGVCVCVRGGGGGGGGPRPCWRSHAGVYISRGAVCGL